MCMTMNKEVTEDRIIDYVRIRKAQRKDPEKIHRGLQQGLRIKHPERIMGYAAFFSEMGDVYASGYVASRMNGERFSVFVMDSLRKFEKGDYGDISDIDEEQNIEDRCLFGIDRAFGRYGYYPTDQEKERKGRYNEVICVRMHGGNTWVTADSERDWFLFLKDEQLPLLRDRATV